MIQFFCRSSQFFFKICLYFLKSHSHGQIIGRHAVKICLSDRGIYPFHKIFHQFQIPGLHPMVKYRISLPVDEIHIDDRVLRDILRHLEASLRHHLVKCPHSILCLIIQPPWIFH